MPFFRSINGYLAEKPSMNPEDDYLAVNRRLWDARTHVHLKAPFYKMEAFLNGASSLNDVERQLLGELKGKSLLHLQCHFGQDSLSLAGLGASVTGVDFSEESIREANRLAVVLDRDCRFICCDVYSLPDHLKQHFDLVFTSYGTVGWLPELRPWANIIHQYLKPGGRLIMVDFHPLLWMYDPAWDRIIYSYFNQGPIVETEQGSYADKDGAVALPSVGWNHSLSEIIQNLLDTGLKLTQFQEFPYSPYPCFGGMKETAAGQYVINGFEGLFPMIYSLDMRKPEALRL